MLHMKSHFLQNDCGDQKRRVKNVKAAMARWQLAVKKKVGGSKRRGDDQNRKAGSFLRPNVNAWT